MSKLKVSTVLTRAAKYLDEVGWTQGVFFRHRNGVPLSPKEGESWGEALARAQAKGCRACALGAMHVGARGDEVLVGRATSYVVQATGRRFVASWNDAPGRIQADVVQVLKEAAKAARKDGK